MSTPFGHLPTALQAVELRYPIPMNDSFVVRSFQRFRNLTRESQCSLQRLAEIDARKSRVVEMRFFGGLTVEETAEVLKVSSITVMRDWNLAKAWLHRELVGDTPSES